MLGMDPVCLWDSVSVSVTTSTTTGGDAGNVLRGPAARGAGAQTRAPIRAASDLHEYMLRAGLFRG